MSHLISQRAHDIIFCRVEPDSKAECDKESVICKVAWDLARENPEESAKCDRVVGIIAACACMERLRQYAPPDMEAILDKICVILRSMDK